MPTWHSYTEVVQQADAGRYFLLYHYGGIYIDLDISCNNSIDSYLQHVPKHKNIIIRKTLPKGIAIDTMIVKPGSPLLEYVVTNMPYDNRWYIFPYPTVMFCAGTFYFGTIFDKFLCKDQVDLVPVEYFTSTYFVHHHASSWHSWDAPVVTFVYYQFSFICKTIAILGLFAFLIASVHYYKKWLTRSNGRKYKVWCPLIFYEGWEFLELDFVINIVY